MTGHTIRNTANQEAGYEGYQHEDPTSIRHKIGLGAVYQRLTTTFGAALLSSNNVIKWYTYSNQSYFIPN